MDPAGLLADQRTDCGLNFDAVILSETSGDCGSLDREVIQGPKSFAGSLLHHDALFYPDLVRCFSNVEAQ